MIIAVVGLPGSGKSEATNRFLKAKFARVGFNDVFYEEFDKRGIERVQKQERPIREELRKKFGMDVAAIRSMPKIEKLLSEGKNTVIESFYSWESYVTMKSQFDDQFKVVAIYAPTYVRYARLSARKIRPLVDNEGIERDYAQIENLHQAGPIAMADWTIKNLGTKEDFFKEVDELIKQII